MTEGGGETNSLGLGVFVCTGIGIDPQSSSPISMRPWHTDASKLKPDDGNQLHLILLWRLVLRAIIIIILGFCVMSIKS